MGVNVFFSFSRKKIARRQETLYQIGAAYIMTMFWLAQVKTWQTYVDQFVRPNAPGRRAAVVAKETMFKLVRLLDMGKVKSRVCTKVTMIEE